MLKARFGMIKDKVINLKNIVEKHFLDLEELFEELKEEVYTLEYEIDDDYK